MIFLNIINLQTQIQQWSKHKCIDLFFLLNLHKNCQNKDVWLLNLNRLSQEK